MAENTEDIKWLYGKLKDKGYDIGSEEEFTASLADKEDRNWYYGKAKDMGLEVGSSQEEFDSLFAPMPTATQASQTAQASQPTQKSYTLADAPEWALAGARTPRYAPEQSEDGQPLAMRRGTVQTGNGAASPRGAAGHGVEGAGAGNSRVAESGHRAD